MEIETNEVEEQIGALEEFMVFIVTTEITRMPDLDREMAADIQGYKVAPVVEKTSAPVQAPVEEYKAPPDILDYFDRIDKK